MLIRPPRGVSSRNLGRRKQTEESRDVTGRSKSQDLHQGSKGQGYARVDEAHHHQSVNFGGKSDWNVQRRGAPVRIAVAWESAQTGP